MVIVLKCTFFLSVVFWSGVFQRLTVLLWSHRQSVSWWHAESPSHLSPAPQACTSVWYWRQWLVRSTNPGSGNCPTVWLLRVSENCSRTCVVPLLLSYTQPCLSNELSVKTSPLFHHISHSTAAWVRTRNAGWWVDSSSGLAPWKETSQSPSTQRSVLWISYKDYICLAECHYQYRLWICKFWSVPCVFFAKSHHH